MTQDDTYREAEREIAALIEGLDDPIATMASCASVLHQRLDAASWTGFYRVVAPDLLRVGPYQGPPACLEIAFDRGVCGAVATSGESLVVPDVHAFPGHVACDPGSLSEVVVPVFDPAGKLVAVLDLDSHLPAAFDDGDRRGLERIARLLTPSFAA